MSNDVDEVDVRITEYDIDHLRGGQPVFKAVGENTRLVLRPDEYERPV